MASHADLPPLLLDLTLRARETPQNPRSQVALPDVKATLDGIYALYHVAPAALILSASLPDLISEFRWQQLPERTYDFRRARRWRLDPELYYLLREYEEFQRPAPRIAAPGELHVRQLSLQSPLNVVFEIPWDYVLGSGGFWLFLKVLPSMLGTAEDVILFRARLRRRRAEEERDRVRAEREAAEESARLLEAQRELAEARIQEREPATAWARSGGGRGRTPSAGAWRGVLGGAWLNPPRSQVYGSRKQPGSLTT